MVDPDVPTLPDAINTIGGWECDHDSDDLHTYTHDDGYVILVTYLEGHDCYSVECSRTYEHTEVVPGEQRDTKIMTASVDLEHDTNPADALYATIRGFMHSAHYIDATHR